MPINQPNKEHNSLAQGQSFGHTAVEASAKTNILGDVSLQQ